MNLKAINTDYDIDSVSPRVVSSIKPNRNYPRKYNPPLSNSTLSRGAASYLNLNLDLYFRTGVVLISVASSSL